MTYFSNPYAPNQRTAEHVRFERALRRARQLLDDLRAGEEEFRTVVRAIDRAEDLSRFVSEAGRERAAALRRELATAEEQGREARQRLRSIELRRLREQERERRARR